MAAIGDWTRSLVHHGFTRILYLNGHGGNIALRQLAGLDPTHVQHFQFSILRVFGPTVPTAEVDETESYYKRALLTREHGLNRN